MNQLDPNILATLAMMFQGQQGGGQGPAEMPNFYNPANPAAPMPNHFAENDAAEMPNFAVPSPVPAKRKPRTSHYEVPPPGVGPMPSPQGGTSLPASGVTGSDAMNMQAPGAGPGLAQLMQYYARYGQ